VVSFLRRGDASVMWARLESPRASYATPAPPSGTTRAPRRRQLPTNHGHADRSFGATRVYQPDSSSKTPHPPLRAVALRNLPQHARFTARTRPPRFRLAGPISASQQTTAQAGREVRLRVPWARSRESSKSPGALSRRTRAVSCLVSEFDRADRQIERDGRRAAR
jgi:hypothetical protein